MKETELLAQTVRLDGFVVMAGAVLMVTVAEPEPAREQFESATVVTL